MDRKLRENFAVQGDLLFLQSFCKARVCDSLCAESRVKTDNPERTEITLLEPAVAVGTLPRADHRFVRFDERGAAHAAVAFRKSANLLVSAVPNNSTFDAHKVLKMRDESFDTTLVDARENNRAVQTLLTAALLLQEVAPAAALERELAATGFPEPLLRAAVGLHLGHTGAQRVKIRVRNVKSGGEN